MKHLLKKYLKEDAGEMDSDKIWMTDIKLFTNSNSMKNKISEWAESMGAIFVKDYMPGWVVIEDKYTAEIMQAFQSDIDGTGKSSFYLKDPKTGKLYREKIELEDSFKKLSEGGTITGGGYWAAEDAAGNASGQFGPAAAEDPPPGHGYLGHRYRRGGYDNRLTNYNTIWRVDDDEEFVWDWFPMCSGQEDYANFSETVDNVGVLFPERTWNNVTKKMTNVPKRLRSSRFSILKKQPYRTSDNTLSNHPEDQQGETMSANIPSEIVMEKKINKYLFESTWTGMGDEAGNSYPDDGSGIASDDDRPPGNILMAPRYKRGEYYNKLTPYKSIWKHDEDGGWYWDWFAEASGQDAIGNYSKTLKSMRDLFPDETWEVAWRAMKPVSDKEGEKRFDLALQPYRKADDVIGHHDADQQGGKDEVADTPKELETNEMSILNKIDNLLIDTCGKDHGKKKKKKSLYESKVSQTIYDQIESLDRFAFASWGSKNFVGSDKALQFDVRGPKFKGRVIVTYDRGKDTYIVEFGNIRKLDWKLKKRIEPVFAQDLVNVLDGQIG